MDNDNYVPFPIIYDAISEILLYLESQNRFKQAEIENLSGDIPRIKEILDSKFIEMENNLKAFYKYKTGRELD